MCDESSPETIFEHNIAHSVGGFGFVSEKSNRKEGTDCTEIAYLKGYKNWKSTAHHADSTGELRCHDITSVDSGLGVTCMGSPGGKVEIYDNTIFGTKDMANVDFTKCSDTYGVIIPTYGGCLTAAEK
jgi:hypothetical protein